MSSTQDDHGGADPTPPISKPKGTSEASRGRGRRRAFGHSADRAHVVEEEGAAISDAARRVLGGETSSSIVAEWNRRALPTASGGRWRVNSFSSLLLQPRLAGLRSDGTPFPTGIHPPNLDPDSHARLIALHATRRKGTRRATRHYLLAGLLRCWRCGGSLRGMPRTRGPDLYVCPGPPHGGCSGTAITADHADGAARDLVLAHLDSSDFVALAAASGQRRSLGSALRLLAGKLDTIESVLVGVGDRWARGEISREQWMSKRQPLVEKSARVRVEMERLRRLDAAYRLADTGGTLRARWSSLTVEEQRSVLDAVLDHAVVLAAEPSRQVFRPERLQPVWIQ